VELSLINSNRKLIIDDEDYNKLYNIHPDLRLFDCKGVIALKRRVTFISVSRIILNLYDRAIIPEHKNLDYFDCRKENLRIATKSQNQFNKRKISNKTTSFFKNVHWHVASQKWYVCVRHNGKRTYGGTFEDEELAARKADELMKSLHGEFAKLNFP